MYLITLQLVAVGDGREDLFKDVSEYLKVEVHSDIDYFVDKLNEGFQCFDVQGYTVRVEKLNQPPLTK